MPREKAQKRISMIAIASFIDFSARFCDKAQAELARSKARAGALGFCSHAGLGVRQLCCRFVTGDG